MSWAPSRQTYRPPPLLLAAAGTRNLGLANFRAELTVSRRASYRSCAMAGTETAKPKRRTQAERRASTRGALLEATIDCLVEFGYGDTTTTRIVERAGVSRGAQVHHYPTKADLVAEAVAHLAKRRTAEFFEEVTERDLTARTRITAMLDEIWAVHSSPLFAASMELIVAARTDRELRERFAEVDREVNREIVTGIVGLTGKRAPDPAVREAMDAGLAAIRGLALMRFVDPANTDRRWPALRRGLVVVFEAALAPQGKR
jgi:AcrR family transcriptional regulator